MVPWPPARGRGPGQPKRRAFTAAYKARIVQEYDQLQTGRERGALLRREGLYSSHITDWRKSRDAGAANGLADKQAQAGTQRGGGGNRAAAARE